MEFFKRHYEKIILFSLSLLLILLLIRLLSTVATVDTSPLNSPEMHRVDHAPLDFKEGKFDIPKQLGKANDVWNLTKQEGFVVDLTSPMLIARCPFCERLLPLQVFLKGSDCPFQECGRKLPEPERDILAAIQKKYAWGVANVREEDLYDDDMDGFSYRYEIEQGFDPSISASHPALWERLYVTDVKRMELGGRLTVVNAPSDSDEKSWYIQIDTPVIGRDGLPTEEKKRNLLFLRDSITLDGNKFQLVEITPRYPQDATDVSASASNDSTARLKQVSGEAKLELELKINEPAYYPEQKIFMKDLGSKEEYRVDVDDIIVMGNNMIGQFRYKVEARDTDKKQVTLIDEMGNRTVIGQEAIVPEEMRVKQRSATDMMMRQNIGENGPMMNMPMMNMPVMNRRNTRF